MKLSEEQFSNMLAALGCGEASCAQEKYSRGRMPVGTRAVIISCGDAGRGEIMTVLVLNLSESGIAILNDVPMNVGHSFILRLPASQRQPAGAVLCSIVHAQRTSNGMYAVGARFQRLLVVQNDKITGTGALTQGSDSDLHDVDHVREVESRLNQLSW